MKAVYLETSALCQALVNKVAEARAVLDHALASRAKLVTSAITFAEFGRTMLRALRDGEIEAEEHHRARRFARDIATTSFVLALDEVLLS